MVTSKNLFYVLVVPVVGFILLNLTFLFDFLVQSFLDQIFVINLIGGAFPSLKHIIFAAIILLISWSIFKSRLADIIKAVYLTVPSAVVFVTIGITLYHWPVLIYGVSVLILGAALFYLFRTKRSWLYYYAVSLVAAALLITGLLGVDI